MTGQAICLRNSVGPIRFAAMQRYLWITSMRPAPMHCSVQWTRQSQSTVRISVKIAAIALYADLFSSPRCLYIIVVFHFLVWFIRGAWNSLSLFLYVPYLGR